MHRIPLQLSIPSVLWERSLPECVLFEKTLNVKNVFETQAFMDVLDAESEFYQRQCYGIAEDMFWKSKNCLQTSDPASFSEGMYLINSIILRAPKDSKVLACALKLRGQFYYHDCCFEYASNDFEMVLHINKTVTTISNEGICEMVGHLIICLYKIGQDVKAKKYVKQYNKYKAKLPSDVLKSETFEQIENHIARFVNELNEEKKGIANPPPNVLTSRPFKKFNGIIGKDGCIYSDFDYKKSDIIFLEESELHTINAPFVRCEMCYRQCKQQIYTCLDCRYKVYCSLRCLEKDSATHSLECIGYKQLSLLILDGSAIFRTFLKISNELNEHIFTRKVFRKYKTALDIWFNLLQLMEATQLDDTSNCLSLIAMEPLYNHLTDTQYSTLVTTAFRLAIFIDKKTKLIETYYSHLQISSKQKLIIVGALLMRIHCNLLLNTFDFEIKGSDIEAQLIPDAQHVTRLVTSSSPSYESKIKDLNQFYDVDIDKEVWQRSLQILKCSRNTNKITPETLPRNQHTQQCNRVYRILSIYKDNVAELYFNAELINKVLYGPNADQPINSAAASSMCARLAQMTDVQRCYFVKRFARLFHNHYTEYFMQMADHGKEVQQVLSVYSPTLRQFRHSCDPNVEIILLDNGVVAGKALRTIKKGEQLYVAYHAHYMRHSRRERQNFLKQCGIKCQCIYCKCGDFDDPITLRGIIYCETCRGMEITREQNECPKCGTQYNNMLLKYRTVVNVLENELNRELRCSRSNEMSDRDIYILHLMIYLHAKKYFGPQNEYRINIELKHARYLAYKNFACQSFDLIMEVRNNILRSYDEHFIWFTFYAEILLTINVIICYNIEKRLYPISSETLMQLCDLGIYIVKGQVELIEFYEVIDRKCSQVLEDLKLLLEWKVKIADNNDEPLIDVL